MVVHEWTNLWACLVGSGYIIWGGQTRPNVSGSIPWADVLNRVKRRKRAEHQPALISLLPDGGRHVASCPALLPPCLPLHDGLCPQSASANKLFLALLLWGILLLHQDK